MKGDVIRAGVIGAGNMGAHHARVYAALTGECALAGVFDPDRERARSVAERWSARAFESLELLLDEVDLVTVASPSHLHLEHAATALEAGKDVLVEKPLALTVEDGHMLERIASLRERRPVAAVGHIEHFNPAVVELRKLLAEHDLVALDVRRLGPFDGRGAETDVVQDLMLHDIHVLLSLSRSPLVDVQARGRALRGDGGVDYAVATFTFESGLIATLQASRVTEDKVRCIAATTTDAHATVDLMQRTVRVSRWTSLRASGDESGGYRQESVVERVFVPVEEPLVAQIHSFLRCVRDRTEPEVPLSAGTACLEVVEAVRTQIARQSRTAALVAP